MLKCAKSFFLSGTKSKEGDITCTFIKNATKENRPLFVGGFGGGGWLVED